MVVFRYVAMVLALLLAGCTTTTTLKPEAALSNGGAPDSAVGVLLNQAQKAQAKGDLAAADGWLVRAMRISPTAPVVYYRMALLRKQQGQPDQARQLASRALSLAPDKRMKRDINKFLQQL
ncbi:tetratricopeptide repeat protein [Candidatus Sororendozoicomonas aggregata]|uniref:tetratricopeptide repeat protein n=1 Tax=Candidatus Sororendozoicomonas aggregata TaxID=3073239 RepID=UPI002ED4CB5F